MSMQIGQTLFGSKLQAKAALTSNLGQGGHPV
jgi:hypothetical protein